MISDIISNLNYASQRLFNGEGLTVIHLDAHDPDLGSVTRSSIIDPTFFTVLLIGTLL